MGRVFFCTISVYLIIWTKYSTSSYTLNEHQSFLLNGVTTVLKTCLPSTMALLNENAFPILTADATHNVSKVHVAATEWGKGRIVAFSDFLFYIDSLPKGTENDNIKLVTNSIDWVRKNAGKKIGIFADMQIGSILSAHGLKVEGLMSEDIDDSKLLQKFDALVIGTAPTKSGQANLRNFVQKGGGLLLGATGWMHRDKNDMKSLWCNVVLRDTGIFYLGIPAYGSEDCDGKCFSTASELLRDTNSYLVWKSLIEFNWKEIEPRERLNQMMEVLFDRLRYGPNNETLKDEINTATERILEQMPIVIPTPAAPVSQENEKKVLIAYRHWITLLNLVGKTSNVQPHPAAELFPGTASQKRLNKRSLGEQRIREKVEIDGSEGWHNTGLYAQPGEEIKVQALNPVNSRYDLGIQIGVHTDNLEDMKEWHRCPYIVFNNKLKNGTATIANPFGGPIFITSSKHFKGSMKFMIDGGIRAPTFYSGKTNPTEWKESIRNYPAPWGELVGKKLIASIQSPLLSQLDDAQEVVDMWDHIMDTVADLAAIPREREAPFRFIADIQNPIGWMHSGYPINFGLSDQLVCVNVSRMYEQPWDVWSFIHEIGHNHQKLEWNFNGTDEVTNNLFALYALHTIFHCPTNSTPVYSDPERAKRVQAYAGNGTRFTQWQSQSILAFDTYVQLQKAYGWPAYQKVFANYQRLSQDELPQYDNEKIDKWMEMFSRVVGENMAEFFTSWGFPISSEAAARVNDLPPTKLRMNQLFQ